MKNMSNSPTEYREQVVSSNVFKEFEYSYERGLYGVSDCDVWDFDMYICNVLKNGFELFKRKKIGHPYGKTSEEWDSIIDRIIYCLNVTSLEPDDSIYDTFNIKKGDVSALHDYQKRHLKEALDLIYEWFYDFWT